jgi:cytochrome c oxidase subunit II
MRALWDTKLLAPVSTWVQPIFELSLFVLSITAAILIVGFALLAYSVVKFRRREDDGRFRSNGSDQTGLAWTVIPILIVVALFSASDRHS